METTHTNQPGALHAQFAAFVADFRARKGLDKPKAAPAARPAPAPVDREALSQELRALLARHDSAFEFSDDHTVWAKGRDEAARIAQLRRLLAGA